MRRVFVAERPSGVPKLLTVTEAARALGISRSLAYQLAQRYLDSGGTTGLPVMRLAARLRVPEWTLIELRAPAGSCSWPME